jgi:hypothetical protein
MSVTPDAAIVSEKYRSPITAQRHQGGSIVVRAARSLIVMSPTEIGRLAAFAEDRRRIQLAVGS